MKSSRLLDDEFVAKLEQLELVARRLVAGAAKGERLSRKRGRSNEFADFRPYAAGDDLRFLDWNAYARLERLFLKLYMEEEDLRLTILIDTSPSMDFGNPSKLEYAKKVAAALGYIALIHQDRVQVSGFSRRSRAVFGPARGRMQARRLLEVLGSLEIDEADGTDLEASCRGAAATRGGGGGIILFFSDFFDKSGFEKGLRYLTAGGRGTEIFAFHILAPQEIDPDLKGDLRLVDVEDAGAVEVSMTAPVLQSYRSTLEAFREEIREFCSRRGIHYLFSPTSVPFDRLVLEILRKRGLLR